MNQQTIGLYLRIRENIRGHLWHRYSRGGDRKSFEVMTSA